ncbi:hypothetical protein MTO96_012356 [Rhipicephalus appendiculatus]
MLSTRQDALDHDIVICLCDSQRSQRPRIRNAKHPSTLHLHKEDNTTKEPFVAFVVESAASWRYGVEVNSGSSPCADVQRPLSGQPTIEHSLVTTLARRRLPKNKIHCQTARSGHVQSSEKETTQLRNSISDDVDAPESHVSRGSSFTVSTHRGQRSSFYVSDMSRMYTRRIVVSMKRETT